MTVEREFALRYAAELGWRVLPLWPQAACAQGTCGSSRCRDPRKGPTAWGKHPRIGGWQREASRDPARVLEWWESWPDAGVGVATGEGSGIVVVDVDPRAGGAESWQRVEEEALVPDTLRQVTSGGFHLVYRYDGRIPEKLRPLPGIEVLTNGQQVVVPPTTCGYGQARVWVPNATAEMGELGDYLLRLHRDGAGGEARVRVGGGRDDGRIFPDGERNDELTRRVGRWRNQHSDDERVIMLLAMQFADERCDPKMPAEEVVQTVRSVMRMSRDSLEVDPRALAWATAEPDRPVGEGGGLDPEDAVGPDPPEGARFLLNEYGDAGRLLAMRGEDLLHVSGLGWLCWDGRKWHRSEQAAQEMAARYVLAHVMDREVPAAGEDRARQQLERWGVASQNARRVSATLKLAAPRVHRDSADDMDADPMILPVENGTVDLRTGELRPHRRSDLATMTAPVRYDPDARAPAWEDMLRKATHDEADLWFLVRAIGYTLTGLTDAKCFFMLYGPANNGKSTLLEALARMLGPYAALADDEVFVESAGSDHKTVLARLGGRRMVVLSELAEGARLKESTAKKVTGDGTLVARFMRQDSFEFTPRMKLWVGTNHQPTVYDVGEAMRSRPRVMEFPHNFKSDPGHRPLKEIKEALDAERSGMLNLALRGLQGYLEEGLEPTPRMAAATADWFDSADSLGQFLAERTRLAMLQDGEGSTLRELYGAYQMWVAVRGERQWGIQTLRKKLHARKDVQWRDAQNPRDGRIYGIVIAKDDAISHVSGHEWP